MRVLVGDIGGTKSLLAIAEVSGGEMRLLHERRFPSPEYGGLEAIVREYLAGVDVEIESACFGVPCPLVGEECETPNLPWKVHAESLADATGSARALLVNDFSAVGYGIGRLGPEGLVTIQEGEREERGAIAVLGAGTGFGQGFLVWEGDGYAAHPSEGGHADFAPRNELEWGLLEFLQREHDHVSWERVLSGPGLAGIYRYLAGRARPPESPEVRAEMEASDPAEVITRRGLDGSDETCRRALDLFVSLYGAEAGNLALKVLATGGVYIAGGIAPRIVEKVQDGTLLRAFRTKGRFSDLMERVPLHVVVNPRVALLGAAHVASLS